MTADAAADTTRRREHEWSDPAALAAAATELDGLEFLRRIAGGRLPDRQPRRAPPGVRRTGPGGLRVRARRAPVQPDRLGARRRLRHPARLGVRLRSARCPASCPTPENRPDPHVHCHGRPRKNRPGTEVAPRVCTGVPRPVKTGTSIQPKSCRNPMYRSTEVIPLPFSASSVVSPPGRQTGV